MSPPTAYCIFDQQRLLASVLNKFTSLSNTKSKCRPRLEKCIWSVCNLDFWPMTLTTFQQCTLTWRIFVLSFIEIHPLSSLRHVKYVFTERETTGKHNVFVACCLQQRNKEKWYCRKLMNTEVYVSNYAHIYAYIIVPVCYISRLRLMTMRRRRCRKRWTMNISLSLIHIWRCRRSTLCRSRWSPYH